LKKKRFWDSLKNLLILLVMLLSSLGTLALSPIKAIESADVSFDRGSAAISAVDVKTLRAFVQRSERHIPEAIVVMGHSARGEQNPRTLSEQRAMAVVELLIKLGVSPSRIFSDAKSDTQPISVRAADTHKNRRVELEFVGNYRPHSLYAGFTFLYSWNEQIRASNLKVKMQTQLDPLSFSKRIQESDLKQLFLLKLTLHSLVTGNDLVLLTIAEKIELCGSVVDGLPNPYLYALLLDNSEAKRALQKCNAQSTTTVLHRLEVFRRAFCESSLQRSVIDYEAIKKALFPDQSWISSVKDELAAQLFACSLSLERARWLLAQGIKLPAVSVNNRPLLFMAVDKGDIELMRMLLDAGSDARERALGGETVLHRVSRDVISIPYRIENSMPLEKQKELWDLLIARGANPEVSDDRGQKPKAP
jgi:OmpA family